GTVGATGGSIISQGSLLPDTTGLIQVVGDSFVNQGTIGARSGASLQLTVLAPNAGELLVGEGGSVSMTNGYTQLPGGRTIVELGTGSTGLVSVTGVADLDGMLEARPLAGFAPAAGDRFRFMSFASRTGGFATVEGTDLGGGLGLDLDESDATDLELVVVGP
ncbi:MAG: hypothetical protein ACX98W_11455, partial [bacterium]